MTCKTEPECTELLNKIFDEAPSLINAIAPEGWAKSAYVYFLHPTPQQQYEQYMQMAENLKRLLKDQPEEPEEIHLDDFKQDDLTNVPEFDESIYVFGLSLWDIFSNNHEVFDTNDERVYDLGSFRGSAHTIADFLNEKYHNDSGKYDYLDFYMGTIYIDERADLLPFYEFVFRILKTNSCDWKYHFPRLYAFNFEPNDGSRNEPAPQDYNPEKALMGELERKEIEAERKKFEDDLEASFHKEFEEAKYKPLTTIVQAYKNVFGLLPNGHPQKDFE